MTEIVVAEATGGAEPGVLAARSEGISLRVGAAVVWLSVIVLAPLAAIAWQAHFQRLKAPRQIQNPFVASLGCKRCIFPAEIADHCPYGKIKRPLATVRKPSEIAIGIGKGQRRTLGERR